MSSRKDHNADCQKILGQECNEVNAWLDDAFRKFGPRHRFVKHHWEGVAKAEELFGETGKQAAIIHILRDCGHIPSAKDYEDGTVDVLGFKQDDGEYFIGHWDAIAFRKAVSEHIPSLEIKSV
jgi:hypothetical protein